MRISERSRIAVAATFLALVLPCAKAMAQDHAAHLRDFVHYVNVARPELAEANLQKLLDSGLTDAELAELIDETMSRDRLDAAMSRGRAVLGLRDIVSRLETRLREGEKDLARNSERIEESIKMLSGTLRQQRYAEELLLEAGEYAVPALLKQVTDGNDPALRQRSVDLLEKLGRMAVTPLSEALMKLDAESQVRVADILGRIGNAQAGPYLSELAADTSAQASAREAAQRAASKVGAGDAGLSTQFGTLSRQYYTGGEDFTAYPAEATNNVWNYDAFVGLVPTEVPTPIYNEVMAMRLARKALQLDANNAQALSTFVAADLKRENDLPDGETDPIFGESPYTADFYALAAGPDLMQMVLGLALDTQDTALVRDAVKALAATGGAGNLFASGQADRQPLLETLNYPDRRARYDAALALGKALPVTGFVGDFSVVPLLASAVRAGDATYALVIADDPEDQATYTEWLTNAGYEVVARGGNLSETESQVASASGIDVIVVRQGVGGTQETIAGLRRAAKTSVAPIVVLTTATEQGQLEDIYEDDRRVQVRVANIDSAAFGNILDDSILKASGGRMTEEDAMAYSFEAIGTLYNIAVANSPVYNIADAETALVDALNTREGGVRLRIADVLAYIPTDRAQRALFDAAFAATEQEQIDLLHRVAESAKRHGDRAEERHVTRLLELVQQGGPVGEAAARVHGALNLSADNVVKIIAND